MVLCYRSNFKRANPTEGEAVMQVFLRHNRLWPVTKNDAELIEKHGNETIFNLKSTKLRSNPQHNLYWSILRSVCKSTDKWPTETHLHYELKIACGYFNHRYSPLTDSIIRQVDSISFQKMTPQEFNEYFDKAMQKLSECVGYDVVEER